MKKYRPIAKLISQAWEIDKISFILTFIGMVLQTIMAVITMYLPATVIDMITIKKDFSNVVFIIGIFAITLYLVEQINEFLNLSFRRIYFKLSKRLETKISEKSFSLSYKDLEDPDTLDLIQRAELPLSWGIVQYVFFTIKNILVATSTILGLILILFFHSKIYTLAIFSILIIVMYIRIKTQEKMDRILQENVPVNRKFGYFVDASTSPNNQKEFRIFGISELMASKVNKFSLEIAKWIMDIEKTSAKKEMINSISTALITFISISYNAIRLVGERFGPQISIGQFTLIYNSTNNIMKNMQTIASELTMLNNSATNLTPWMEYINKEDEILKGNEIVDKFESLEFKNVSFTYPNSNKIILDNVSFKINKGEKISIVGLNNAGKSTIVKLICRFYLPDSGEILWNGTNINEYNPNYLDEISAVFQDFQLLPYSIFENIMAKGENREMAIESLKKVKMWESIEKLENKMDTPLWKELDEGATRFSGGQNQKLAIARAINKDGSLMIMDEPTAALDPIAESEIFENFAELTKGKTSIFISHRMSSSTFSDKVLLLDGGKIVGFDTHSNLMKGHNLYKELFETQAKNYS